MNSVSRAGLTIAGLVTTAMVAGVFFVQGFAAAQQSSAPASVTATVNPTQAATDSSAPSIIYVNPVPSPSVINTTQTAPPDLSTPPVVHVIVPSRGGDDDGGGDD